MFFSESSGQRGAGPFNEKAIPICDDIGMAQGLQQKDLVHFWLARRGNKLKLVEILNTPLDGPNPDRGGATMKCQGISHKSWSCSFNAAKEMHLATKVCPLAWQSLNLKPFETQTGRSEAR